MRILVIPTSKYIEYINSDKKQEIELFIDKNALYLERDKAETDPTHLQIIPYVIVHKEDKIFAYSRLKKGSESRLHGKMSIGIGGHVDEIEHNTNYAEVVWHSAYRELFEELNIQLTEKFLDIDSTKTFIYDPSNDVGKVHLGLLMKCNVKGRKVTISETDKIQGRFFYVNELEEMYHSDPQNFENWSGMALKELKII